MKTKLLQSLIAKNTNLICKLEKTVARYKFSCVNVYPRHTEIHQEYRERIRQIKKTISELANNQRDYRNLFRDTVNRERQAKEAAKTPDVINKTPNVQGVGDVNGTTMGSGARYNAGKPDLSLIPLDTLYGEAQVWMYGALKYSRNNWKRGMAWSIPLACALRHLAKWQSGEENDPESGLPHLDHAACNIRMLKYYSTAYPEGDDRK